MKFVTLWVILFRVFVSMVDASDSLLSPKGVNYEGILSALLEIYQKRLHFYKNPFFDLIFA